MNDEVVLKFLQVLEGISEDEMPCSEFYAHVDEFVEQEVKSKNAKKIMPLLQEHLELCSECCDEYEGLLDVIEHTQQEDLKK
ncbi:MAG: hypothetical protein Fur002_17230 [Anaerolineales bacterium]